MDPKTPANLDPKLKEVYERVMGTPVSPSQGGPTSAPIPKADTTPLQPPEESELPSQTIAAARAETLPVTQTTPTEHVTNQEAVPHPFPKTSFVANQVKTGSNIMPLIIVGLIIFFAGYTIFWLKFFNINLIPLPF